MCAQSCPTLCNSVDCSQSGSTVHEIFQAGTLECKTWEPPLPSMYSVAIEKLMPVLVGQKGCRNGGCSSPVRDAPDLCLVGAKDPKRTNSSANECFYSPVLTARGGTPSCLCASPEWAWLMCTRIHFLAALVLPPPRPRSVAMTTVAGSPQTVWETLAAG